MLTLIIIGVISLVSVMAFSNRTLFHRWLFSPYLISEKKQWFRFFTHLFLHAGYPHLIFNMLTLYFFGDVVEYVFARDFPGRGELMFVLFFFVSGFCASVPAYYKHRGNIYYSAVGASGAVSAILFASILFNPLAKIYIFFIPIGIPAFIFGILFLIFSARMARQGTDNVAHDTHFWGSVFGFVFPLAFHHEYIFIFFQQITHAF